MLTITMPKTFLLGCTADADIEGEIKSITYHVNKMHIEGGDIRDIHRMTRDIHTGEYTFTCGDKR